MTTTAHLRGVYLGAAAAKSSGPDGRRRAPPSQASGSVYSGPRSSQRVFLLGMDRDVVLRLSIRAQATPAKRRSATNGLCAERMSAREKCLRVDAYVKSVSSKEDEREPKKNLVCTASSFADISHVIHLFYEVAVWASWHCILMANYV